MNMPKLRFKDDSGQDFPEWEEKTLGEIVEVKGGKRLPKGSLLQTENNGKPYITVSDMYNGGVDTKNIKYVPIEIAESIKNYKIDTDDIFISVAGTLGIVGIIPKQLNGANLTENANKLTNLKCNQWFLLQYLMSDSLEKLIDSAKTTNAQPKLAIYAIKSFPIFLPPAMQEQTKIANFLTSVDDKIAELTKKVALLQRYKKGVMQQIFSQQLRFKDDDGQDFPEWEEKTLGEIANLKRGASPRPIADQKWFSDSSIIGWVRISDVSRSHKYLNHTEQYLSEEGISKSRFVKKGSIIMSICATIGKPIYTNFEVCIHDGFIVFEELQINPEFLYYYLLLIEKNWHQYGQPGSQVNLNTDIVSKEFIYVPIEKEQTKIANFLSALDEQINTSQQQLSLSKQYKQSLLQQMFV